MSDFTSLPKYARLHIAELNREIESLRAQLDGDNADSDVSIYGSVRPLPRNSAIVFSLPGEAIIAARKDGYLEIRTNDGALEVQSQSSNVIKVRTGKWWS